MKQTTAALCAALLAVFAGLGCAPPRSGQAEYDVTLTPGEEAYLAQVFNSGTYTDVCTRVIDGRTIELEELVDQYGKRLRVVLINLDAFEIEEPQIFKVQAASAGLSPDEARARGHAQGEELRRQIEGRTVTIRPDPIPSAPGPLVRYKFHIRAELFRPPGLPPEVEPPGPPTDRDGRILARLLGEVRRGALGLPLRPGPRILVARCACVINGNYIRLDDGRIVRLVDRDAFETQRCERLEQQAKAASLSPDEALARGRAQTEELRRQIEGRTIMLGFDEAP